ncbi:MAG: hypothetical protein AAFN74_05445, partial [Myxococcota bacterium]
MHIAKTGRCQWGWQAMIVLALGTGMVGCERQRSPAATEAFREIPRRDFNLKAAEAAAPFFWVEDTNQNGALEARELAVLWREENTARWISAGQFTPQFAQTYRQLTDPAEPTEGRLKWVADELEQGVPTLVYADFSSASEEDRALVRQMVVVAQAVERLHMAQLGSLTYADQIDALDPRSRALFLRNQAPWCMAPATEGQAGCSALNEAPARISGLYPADLQEKPGFCESLAKHSDAAVLLDRWHAVRRRDGNLVAVPYSEAFKTEM